MRRTNCLKSRIRMTCCLENKFDYNAGPCLQYVSSALTAFGEKPNPVGTWYFTSAHNCDTILNINHLTRTRSIAFLPCKIGRFDTTSFRNHFIIRGFSPWNGERFLSLGPMWNALVRGWRSDCVVGGMETRFQWRKAHNLSAKCEAFHVAPRLFFMFLFLMPFTIRQQCRISPGLFHWARRIRALGTFRIVWTLWVLQNLISNL